MTELSEDIEVVTPGQLLREAREKAGLTQTEIATRLKLRQVVIERIENNEFVSEQTQIFMRGYVRAYARVVGVDEDVVFAAYEQFDVAQQQYAEMQSFSQITQKKAADSRLMALSYIIALVVIGMSVYWWWQEHKEQQVDNQVPQVQSEPETPTPDTESLPIAPEQLQQMQQSDSEQQIVDENENTQPPASEVTDVEQTADEPNPGLEDTGNAQPDVAVTQPPVPVETVEIARLVMTFSGDCWINVVDATGERIAYGVKKAGRIMPVTGVPPFEITLGAPHVVSIIYEDNPVDMSGFEKGKVSRFRLPANNE